MFGKTYSAAEVAENAGALINAGLAVLTLIEEHGATRRLPPAEVYEAYQRAERLLRDTQDAEDKERLLACARVVMRRLSDTPFHEKNFSLYGAVHEFEAKLIGQALDESAEVLRRRRGSWVSLTSRSSPCSTPDTRRSR